MFEIKFESITYKLPLLNCLIGVHERIPRESPRVRALQDHPESSPGDSAPSPRVPGPSPVPPHPLHRGAAPGPHEGVPGEAKGEDHSKGRGLVSGTLQGQVAEEEVSCGKLLS